MASYTVKKGDTLSEIAKQYGTTYQDIAKANGISNPNLIYEGQTLKIGADAPSETVTAPTEQQTPSAPAATQPTAPKYQESDTVKQAQAMLQQQLSQKPGAYQSAWQNQLNDAINKILNREKFSYDLNGDALYQQYKDKYVTQGQQAMMDTMGQAQAMTGGYGNSYAQTAGQQAYHGYLQQLNDKIPELYQLALNQYQIEGNQMLDNAALMAQMEDKDYGRYRDQMGDWLTERDYLSGRYDSERNYDYGQFVDNRNYQYQQDRDKAADEQWRKEFDESLRRFNFQNKLGEFAKPVYTGPAEEPEEEPKKKLDLPLATQQSEEKVTYDDVALTAAQLRQNGATGAEVAQVIKSMVYGKGYVPTTSFQRDLLELRSGYVGTVR